MTVVTVRLVTVAMHSTDGDSVHTHTHTHTHMHKIKFCHSSQVHATGPDPKADGMWFMSSTMFRLLMIFRQMDSATEAFIK